MNLNQVQKWLEHLEQHTTAHGIYERYAAQHGEDMSQWDDNVFFDYYSELQRCDLAGMTQVQQLSDAELERLVGG